MDAGLVVAPPGGVALAVDIGGTKVEVGLVDAGGRVLHRARHATTGADAEQLLGQVLSLVDDVRRRDPEVVPDVCGVGCGGPMTAGGGDGVTGQHPPVAGFSPARPTG